ncbi:MAG: TorF family putative porin [Planctomycetota bacterium]|jgi:hypothetical protein
MKKKGILLLAVVLLSMGGLVQAEEGKLTGTIDVSYLSKYVWRGFDIFGDKSAIQPSIDLDLYGTGFGINVMGHRANSDGFENGERWDYTLYYQNGLFADETYATNYRIGWVYYNYPDQPRRGTTAAPNADLQEVHTILSWPNVCPAGIIPSYGLVKMWPARSSSFSGSRSPTGGTASGWIHIFMLDYPWTVNTEGLLPGTPEQVINLHTELIYNDGVGPAGQNVDQDWSNIVFGASTEFDLGNNLAFTPGIYHQITFDDSVNGDKDETWVSLGMKYRF